MSRFGDLSQKIGHPMFGYMGGTQKIPGTLQGLALGKNVKAIGLTLTHLRKH
jgi:hypothetical protein